MNHIFLTGEIQCGKSTLIQSILHQSADKLIAAGGFLTYFTTRTPNAPRTLYLGDAAIYGSLFGEANQSAYISPSQLHKVLIDHNNPPVIAAKFPSASHPQIDLDAFHVYGRNWIEKGLENARHLSHKPNICPILILDECGYLESNATLFHQAVYQALEAPIPILGVVRQMSTPSWLDTIRKHPNVQLVTVTESNRDALVPQLTKQLLSQF